MNLNLRIFLQRTNQMSNLLFMTTYHQQKFKNHIDSLAKFTKEEGTLLHQQTKIKMKSPQLTCQSQSLNLSKKSKNFNKNL